MALRQSGSRYWVASRRVAVGCLGVEELRFLDLALKSARFEPVYIAIFATTVVLIVSLIPASAALALASVDRWRDLSIPRRLTSMYACAALWLLNVPLSFFCILLLVDLSRQGGPLHLVQSSSLLALSFQVLLPLVLSFPCVVFTLGILRQRSACSMLAPG